MKIPSTDEICDCTCTQLGDCINPQCGSENCCGGFGDCICDYIYNGVTWIPYSIGDSWCADFSKNQKAPQGEIKCCKYQEHNDISSELWHNPLIPMPKTAPKQTPNINELVMKF